VASTGGGRAALFVYPDDDLAVVILTNLMGGAPVSFIDEVAGYYIPSMHPSTGFGLAPAIKGLRSAIMKRGFENALEVLGEAKKKDAKFQLLEDDLNEWGYRLLDHGQTKEAIEIFKLNVNLYPESANAYDSLAEGYEAIGDRASTIKNYKRSLEMNPQNSHAVVHIRKLEPGGTKKDTN
jgi:tetratricopeptide (TPR) repeat protein